MQPFVTVAIVALNRAWIIQKVLDAIQAQTYPHDRMSVIFVDGQSSDGTAQIAKERLYEADFAEHEVIVKRCSIPEGRNLCLEKVQGDLLLFWDSDIIMPPDAISRLVDSLEAEKAHLMTASLQWINIASTDEIAYHLNQAVTAKQNLACTEVGLAAMGNTLMTRELAATVLFDPDLTVQEDSDFCMRARAKGFKLMVNPNVTAMDFDIKKVGHSDTYVDMPLGDALRGIRKKSRAQVYCYRLVGWKSVAAFFSSHKRYLVYLGYLPAFAFSVWGALAANWVLMLCFPVYALLLAARQIQRRGVLKGVKAWVRSLLVGVPNAVWVTVYCAKSGLKRRPR